MSDNTKQLGVILEHLAEQLDVPPGKYQEAKEHYDAVAKWLGQEDSELANYVPTIYPQGSFALGTAVQPLGDDDYDVDAVCLLQADRNAISQKQLKNLVGDRLLHPCSRYRKMISPPEGGRRCWTIKYADGSKFHLDVLPAIPDEYDWLINMGVPQEWAENAICITDKKIWEIDMEWPRSNPKGFAEWFRSRMIVQIQKGRAVLAERRGAEIEEIPESDVRTPLQRLVQILKRHRDKKYNGDDDKPVSVIITTLAAQAYNNESNLRDAIFNVVPAMRHYIENRNGILWVPNPVNPEENFADKWAETPRKQRLFFEWLDAVEAEYRYLQTPEGFSKTANVLAESYGHYDASQAMARYAEVQASKSISVASGLTIIPSRSKKVSSVPVSYETKPYGEFSGS